MGSGRLPGLDALLAPLHGDIADLARVAAEMLIEPLPERGDRLRGVIGIGLREAGEQHRGMGLEARRVELGKAGVVHSDRPL